VSERVLYWQGLHIKGLDRLKRELSIIKIVNKKKTVCEASLITNSKTKLLSITKKFSFSKGKPVPRLIGQRVVADRDSGEFNSDG